MTETEGRTPVTSARSTHADGCARARTLSALVRRKERLDLARWVVFEAIAAYWKNLQTGTHRVGRLRRLSVDVRVSSLPAEAGQVAREIGAAAASLDVTESGYRIGAPYTGLMPGPLRSRLGAHYTPPASCERLIDMATEAGVDWRSARVLDPGCGGGAFLAPGGAAHGREPARCHRREQAEECPAAAARFRAGSVQGLDVARVSRCGAGRPVS